MVGNEVTSAFEGTRIEEVRTVLTSEGKEEKVKEVRRNRMSTSGEEPSKVL